LETTNTLDTKSALTTPNRKKPTWKAAFFLFLAVFGLWMLWSGPYSLPFGHAEGQHEGSWKLIFGLGLFSTLLVVALCWRMRILDEELMPLHLTLPTLRYIPWLFVEVVRSNLDVLRRILFGPIRPIVVTVKASQKGDWARVTYANSITLTPGTLTIEAVDDMLTVHSLSHRGAAVLEKGKLDRRITRLEGLTE
jgi:multicomponent Na+:H+ antiporter subunit E